MGEFVKLTVEDGVGTLRLDRPKLNPLSGQVSTEIDEYLDEIAGDENVRALVVWGGERVFAAGADIKEMATRDTVQVYRYISLFQGVFTKLEQMPIVTIAAVNGYALGGGCELAMACDLRVCAEDAQFGQPEILLGVIPGAGGTQRLPRLVGVGRAKELIYSGRFVGAEEAHRIGLVNEVVAPDKVYERSVELAKQYAAGPTVALLAVKQVIQNGFNADMATGLLLERQAFATLFVRGPEDRDGVLHRAGAGQGEVRRALARNRPTSRPESLYAGLSAARWPKPQSNRPTRLAGMNQLPVEKITMPTPYAVGPVNAYLLKAEPLTLVDGGINTPHAQNAMLLGLAAAELFPEAIERILVTHAHPDHYGLVQLRAGHAPARPSTSPSARSRGVRDRQMLFEVGRLLLEAGMPLDYLFKMDQQRRKDPRPGIDHEQVVPINEGFTFDFTTPDGDFTLETLHMPGHTGGHVVFHEPETHTLFAGDQLLPDVSPNPLLEPSLDEPGERRRSLREYLDSLERMGSHGTRARLSRPRRSDRRSVRADRLDGRAPHEAQGPGRGPPGPRRQEPLRPRHRGLPERLGLRHLPGGLRSRRPPRPRDRRRRGRVEDVEGVTHYRAP